MATSLLKLVAILATAIAWGGHAALAQSAERSNLQREQAIRRAKKAQTDFDAVALQALITPMFAGMKSGPLGSGNAGRYWQSLMTEHVARHIASSGQIQLLTKLPKTPCTDCRKGHAARVEQLGSSTRERSAPALVWQTTVRAAVQGHAENVEQSK